MASRGHKRGLLLGAHVVVLLEAVLVAPVLLRFVRFGRFEGLLRAAVGATRHLSLRMFVVVGAHHSLNKP